ncbi:SH3 domain-containing protein [Chloroflexus sp.]|uniref:SH3 domain-containing protein n=1 Tax=Chloroflexus sp. TaxID=1904827 RepID=UPI0026158D7C|nr:SH3 domain-containing protein [uncultured Chloroflexus sp.]
MINYGSKKEEGGASEGIGVAMRSMSEQIGRQAQEIKRLQEALEAAQQDAAAAEKARASLAEAEARMAQMEAELKRLQAQLAAATASAPTESSGGKSVAGSGESGGIAGAIAGALGGSGAVKIGPATPTASPSTDGGLQIGGVAYVQKAGGKNLRRRQAPGLDSTVLDCLPPGTQLTLLAGPQEKDGYPWWHIRTSDGREGWVAGTELVTEPED